MKKYNVAVLGATGAVGEQMLKALDERNFPLNELRLLSGKRSAGKELEFRGETLTVAEAKENSFSGVDFVLASVESDVVRRFAPSIKAAGAVLIDNSSTFRLDEGVPLVVPEINGADAKTHSGIIANPNCTTIITLMALYPIAKLSPVKTLAASTYQAVSGAGIDGLFELDAQIGAYASGAPIEPKIFKKQILNNLIPKIGDAGENGYTSEEMKLQNEGRKIMHLPDMRVSCTCVRVPVARSHSVSVSFTTKSKVSVEAARDAIASAVGCKLLDDVNNEQYPTPLFTSDQDLVYVGRIREDLVYENGLTLFCCGDQLRKGAAVNAVQIAELLI